MARTLLLITLLFLAGLLVTNPTGDFPLNDDWSYGSTVRTLVEQGRFQLHDWTSMPLLTQVLWGSLFCLPRGFSFSCLRISTLVLSITALFAVTALAFRSGTARSNLPFAPLLLFCNPLFMGLSHTFMTDIPFISLMLISLLLLIDCDRYLLLLLGAAAALAATLLRQTGLLIPLALLIARLVTPHRKCGTFPMLLLTLFCAAALFGYEAIMRSGPGLSSGYQTQYSLALSLLRTGELPAQIAGNLAATLIYTGIFLLPVTLLLIPSANRYRLLVFLAVAAVTLVAVQLKIVRLPGNILTDRGLGPFQLRAAEAFTPFSSHPFSRGIFGILSLAGSALLLEAVYRCSIRFRASPYTSAFLSLASLYFLATLPVPQFDRYMLVYVPLLALTLLPALNLHRSWLRVSAGLLAIYGLFSFTATHDYLAWNRTRWKSLRHLTDELAIPPERIDGGFEFNGLYTFSEDYLRLPGKSRWWVRDDEYVVSLSPLSGYETLSIRPTGCWLPTAPKHIYTLHRQTTRPDSVNSR